MTYRLTLTRALLRAIGALFAHTLARLDRYTKEHREFLSSGFVCRKCNETLVGKWWTAGVNCYDSNGERVPLMQARLKGRYFECPKCLHRWPFRQGHEAKARNAEPDAPPNGGPAAGFGNSGATGGPPSVS